MKTEYKENTIYVRQRGNTWEAFVKALGRGMILSGLDSMPNAVKAMTFILWAVKTFGLEKYGEEMAKVDGAPDGVEYPVILEDPVKTDGNKT